MDSVNKLRGGQEVYLLNQDGQNIFKAEYLPFKHGQERAVHFKLNENEKKLLISRIFHQNLSLADEFNEDTQGTLIKWDLKCISTSSLKSSNIPVAFVSTKNK